MTTPATLLASLSRRPATAEPDAELLGRFVAGRDAAAFAALVRRYARLVWRVARARCRTDATAEDVFQATFAVLSRKAGAIREPAALAGWLHLTAHRLAVKATRRERPTVPLPPHLTRSADPLDTLTARELLAAVDEGLAGLADAERAVLLLCGLDGLSNGDAAARLGWSVGSVKGRLERARAKLRARLSARGLALPAVLVGVVGFAPPSAAVEAAVALPAGGALPPAVANLIAETFTMKAKTGLAVAVAGLLALMSGFVTDTAVKPTAEAAPVPRELKPLPKEAWGEAKGGLQAGLRMPDGATLEVGQSKEIQVVVRNVGKDEREVWYMEQQGGVGLAGDPRDGRFHLAYFAFVNGIPPRPISRVLKSGEEFVRWRANLAFANPDDESLSPDKFRIDEMIDLVPEPVGPTFKLTAGTHRIVMNRVAGDLMAERNGGLTGLDALATGELEVRCVPPRPQPRRNAPVPKAAPKAVLWSEPVRVDWKGSRAESLSGVWAPDGKSVLVPAPTASDKGEPVAGGGIDFREAGTGKVTGTYRPDKGGDNAAHQPISIAIAHDGKTVVAVGETHEAGKKAEPKWGLFVWQGPTGAEPGKVTMGLGLTAAAGLAISPDGTAAALTENGRSAKLIDLRRGLLLATVSFGQVPVRTHGRVAFYPDGRSLVVVNDTGELHAVDGATGKRLGSLGDLGTKFRAVAVSPDGKRVAAGGEPGKDGQSLLTVDGGPNFAKLVEPRPFADAVPAKERINGLAFSADGAHLAAACSDGLLRIFEVATGKLATSAKEHKDEVFGVAYSPDGKKLLTVGKDAIKVWDVSRLLAK